MPSLKRFTSALAGLLRRGADKIDPAHTPVPVHQAEQGGDQLELASQLCREIELRQCLRAALRRYSPREETAQA